MQKFHLCSLCLKRFKGSKRVSILPPGGKCQACQGLLPLIPSLVASAVTQSGKFEWGTFSAASSFPKKVFVNEEEIADGLLSRRIRLDKKLRERRPHRAHIKGNREEKFPARGGRGVRVQFHRKKGVCESGAGLHLRPLPQAFAGPLPEPLALFGMRRQGLRKLPRIRDELPLRGRRAGKGIHAPVLRGILHPARKRKGGRRCPRAGDGQAVRHGTEITPEKVGGPARH